MRVRVRAVCAAAWCPVVANVRSCRARRGRRVPLLDVQHGHYEPAVQVCVVRRLQFMPGML